MRILVVEDEKHLSDALCSILNEAKYMTDAVDNGADALSYAVSGIYDLIVLDVMLPKKNGFEVVSELRRQKITTPVLMLTALDGVKDKVKGLDLGADDYMTKPFSPDELLARIRVLSRRKGEVILDERTYADLVFSVSTSSLSCKETGRKIRLSFKEAEMMKLFLDRPGVYLSKDELITRVWGYDAEIGENNVEAYISFLRKKLHFVGSRCEITAAKKIGYKLEDAVC